MSDFASTGYDSDLIATKISIDSLVLDAICPTLEVFPMERFVWRIGAEGTYNQ